MARLLEPLAWLALAVVLHLLLAAALSLPQAATGARAGPTPAGPLVIGSGQTAALIAAWEAPPAAAPLPAVLAPSPELVPPPTVAPTPAEPPGLRPVLMPQLSLPEVPPVMASTLRLDRSARPETRPTPRAAPAARRERPAATARRQAAPEAIPQSGGGTARAAAPSGQSGGGQGGGAAGGNGANATALMQQWATRISRCIGRNARAPAGVGRGGQVLLALRIGRNGAIQSVGIAASSGNPALDRAALDAARKSGRCPAAPGGLDQASYSFQLPVNPAR